MLLTRRAAAEFVGTALLLVAVVGSGIAAQRYSPGDRGLELLENALATGAALVAIILAVGPVSGAHLNPVITLVDAVGGGLRWRSVPAYLAAQFAGGVVGVMLANAMFSLPAVSLSTHPRNGGGQWLAEAVATFGLVLVVFGIARSRHTQAAAVAVGAYITAAYFFTSSTSFANPAVALARMLSNTFAGIAPASVAMFMVFEVLGGAAAALAVWLLYARVASADDVVVPRVVGAA